MTYNIFISHAWKYSEHYNKVVTWLNEAQAEGQFTWKNYSVPEHNPLIDPNTSAGKTTLKKELKEQISPASKVIVLQHTATGLNLKSILPLIKINTLSALNLGAKNVYLTL